MSIRKNMRYSILLTFSTYLVPLVVFPYISRVLGVEGIGIVDTVDNIIDYCILFSMMGLSTVGIREIARAKSDKERLSKTFADLFSLNIISTIIVAVILVAATFFIPTMYERWQLIAVGGMKLFANMFLTEWLFTGLEDFKYISIRSIVVRTLFVISVFVFVKEAKDYVAYYMLFVGMTIMNAICNWRYRVELFKTDIFKADLKRFIKPILSLGLFAMLSAIYTKLSLPVLNHFCGDIQSGYYATAMRVYQVCIAMISTLVGVLVPRISVLIEDGDIKQVKKLTKKAFIALTYFAVPAISTTYLFGGTIIQIFAGEGFEGAVLPMKIIMSLLLVGGAEKIVILQLLIPLRADKQIVLAGCLGVAVWLVATLLLVPVYQSTGSAIVWVLSELTVLSCASVSLYKILKNYKQKCVI